MPIVGFIISIISLGNLYSHHQWLLLLFFIISILFTLIRIRKEDNWIMLYQVGFSLFPLLFVSDVYFILLTFLIFTFITTLVFFFKKNLQTSLILCFNFSVYIILYFFIANLPWQIAYLISMVLMTLVLSLSDKENPFVITLKYMTILLYLCSIPNFILYWQENIIINHYSICDSIFMTTLGYLPYSDTIMNYIWPIEVLSIIFFLIGLNKIQLLKTKESLSFTPLFVIILGLLYINLTSFQTPIFILLSILGLISLIILSQPKFCNIKFL